MDIAYHASSSLPSSPSLLISVIHLLGAIGSLVTLLSISALGVWLVCCLCFYVMEIAIWSIFERRQGSPKSFIEIMIPDPDMRFIFEIIAAEARIWISDALDELIIRGSADTEGSSQLAHHQELAALLTQINFIVGETKSNDNVCAICLDEFIGNDQCGVFPVCNHIFHLHCINLWLKNQPSCPLCRHLIIDL